MNDNSSQSCQDLLQLVWHVKSTLFHIAESYSLTPPQVFALYSIAHGHKTMGRVAETMHCDASNVTGVIDRLVAQGLVVRSESASDRRAKHLALTAQGERIIQTITDLLPERLGCVQLTEQERTVLRDILHKLPPVS